MKKYFFTLILSLTVLSAFGQAKKPSLMVMPSDIWCTRNDYMEKYVVDGEEILIPAYKKALQTDTDLNNVITKIGILMSDQGFPLKDMASAIRSIERNAARRKATTSKTGSRAAESPADALKRVAKADIILYLDWSINTTGPKKTVTYNLRGVDPYIDKQIAAAQGTGKPSFSAEVPVLLEEAVLINMDNFTAQLQSHFDDLFANGREVAIEVEVFEGADVDLDTEFDGKKLVKIIDEWLSQHTVKRRFSKVDASENFAAYEQVRIPMYDEDGETALDTDAFVNKLADYLKEEPYRLDSKVDMTGLGLATLIIGEK
ncbi:MAG: DUF6175 family protein [Dysgonamonadaceae bacterium]|jgi:hypothetical protein|nr:DUF6175 family protein [Dysgonamonadaceae bacterium]